MLKNPGIHFSERVGNVAQLLNAIWPKSSANVVKCTELMDMEE